MDEKQDRLWATVCHLSALSMYAGVPFGNIVGPLLVWQLKKAEHPALEEHGKEALNFQISMTIYLSLAALSLLLLVGILLVPAVAVAQLVFTILAALRANEGGVYRYPLTIRFLK